MHLCNCRPPRPLEQNLAQSWIAADSHAGLPRSAFLLSIGGGGAPAHILAYLLSCSSGQIGNACLELDARHRANGEPAAPCAALGGNRQYRCRVAIRVGRLPRYAAVLCMCTTHFHLAALRGPQTFFVPFPPRGRPADRSASNLPLGFCWNPSFSPKTDLISMSRGMANVISRFCLAVAVAASVATAKKTVFESVALKRMFSFCFFFFFPTGFETAALSKLRLPLFIWTTK